MAETQNTENAPEIPAEIKHRRPKEEPVVIAGGGDKDTVFLSQCVFKNQLRRKSLTVHHLQRRLGDLGFIDAVADLDGYYGDLTKSSVEQFQASKNYPVTGLVDKKTFSAIFRNDPFVFLVFDAA